MTRTDRTSSSPLSWSLRGQDALRPSAHPAWIAVWVVMATVLAVCAPQPRERSVRHTRSSIQRLDTDEVHHGDIDDEPRLAAPAVASVAGGVDHRSDSAGAPPAAAAITAAVWQYPTDQVQGLAAPSTPGAFSAPAAPRPPARAPPLS